jgi:hypothetical protein
MSNAVLNGLAGAGGGIIAQIITYPLQTVILSFRFFLQLLYIVLYWIIRSEIASVLFELDDKKWNWACRLTLGSRPRGLPRLRMHQTKPLLLLPLLLIEALVAVPWSNLYRFHLFFSSTDTAAPYASYVGEFSGFCSLLCMIVWSSCSFFKLKDWAVFTAASSPLFLVLLLHRFAFNTSYFDLLVASDIITSNLPQLGGIYLRRYWCMVSYHF